MVLSNNISVDALIASVTEALSALPDVRLCRVERNLKATPEKPDTEIFLEIQGEPLCLRVRQAKNAHPSDVRALIEPLRRLHGRDSEIRTMPMLIAPALPETSRQLLREARLAYGDGGGSLYLPLDSGIFYVERPVPRSAARESPDIFKGNTTRVLHILFAEPYQAWHIHDLARRAGVSPSTVHQVFRALEHHLWMESEGKGPARVRVLREPGAVLDAWRDAYSFKSYEAHLFYGWAKSGEALQARVTDALEAAGRDYALTLSSGAALVAPFLTTVPQVSLIVPNGPGLELVWNAAGLEPAEEGANVTVLVSKTDTPLLMRREIEGVWVASDVQLYLDLWASPARGKEQAEHLRHERMKR